MPFSPVVCWLFVVFVPFAVAVKTTEIKVSAICNDRLTIYLDDKYIVGHKYKATVTLEVSQDSKLVFHCQDLHVLGGFIATVEIRGRTYSTTDPLTAGAFYAIRGGENLKYNPKNYWAANEDQIAADAHWIMVSAMELKIFGFDFTGTGVGGDPIYRTLDGVSFEYTGTCPVTLIKDCERERFDLVGYNTPCGLKSCLEELKLKCQKTQSDKYTVVSLSVESVLVDGQEIDVNELHKQDKILQLDGLSMSTMLSSPSQLVVSVHCEAGLHLKFASKHWAMSSVRVSEKFTGRVCGLLGNNNGKKWDDLAYQSGKTLLVSEKDLVAGFFQNQTAILDWVWDWVVDKNERKKEECMHVSDEYLIAQNCRSDFTQDHIQGVCRRMLTMMPDHLCANANMDLLVSQCLRLTCSCFKMPQKMLECAQWSVRELVDRCELKQKLDHEKGIGFVY